MQKIETVGDLKRTLENALEACKGKTVNKRQYLFLDDILNEALQGVVYPKHIVRHRAFISIELHDIYKETLMQIVPIYQKDRRRTDGHNGYIEDIKLVCDHGLSEFTPIKEARKEMILQHANKQIQGDLDAIQNLKKDIEDCKKHISEQKEIIRNIDKI